MIMFLKTENGRFINLNKVGMLYVDDTNICVEINGIDYAVQGYTSADAAHYALDFVMRLIKNVSYGNVYAIPTDETVKFYMQADKDEEKAEVEYESEQDRR